MALQLTPVQQATLGIHLRLGVTETNASHGDESNEAMSSARLHACHEMPSDFTTSMRKDGHAAAPSHDHSHCFACTLCHAAVLPLLIYAPPSLTLVHGLAQSVLVTLRSAEAAQISKPPIL